MNRSSRRGSSMEKLKEKEQQRGRKKAMAAGTKYRTMLSKHTHTHIYTNFGKLCFRLRKRKKNQEKL